MTVNFFGHGNLSRIVVTISKMYNVGNLYSEALSRFIIFLCLLVTISA